MTKAFRIIIISEIKLQLDYSKLSSFNFKKIIQDFNLEYGVKGWESTCKTEKLSFPYKLKFCHFASYSLLKRKKTEKCPVWQRFIDLAEAKNI